ncbi:DUF853 domain-containing protein [Arthrobacter sp. FW306-04-A]|nr:DUF853 domain-containing protein [Arthrobacter sp. FW306-04-A]
MALTKLRAPESVMGPCADDLIRSTQLGRELLRGVFGTSSRRRR